MSHFATVLYICPMLSKQGKVVRAKVELEYFYVLVITTGNSLCGNMWQPWKA